MENLSNFLEDGAQENASLIGNANYSLNNQISPDKESNFDLSATAGSHLQPGTVYLHGTPIVSLWIEGQERLCLAQISNTLLKPYSYNEIHNRRVALGITCVQCTPVQLELLRRAGAMPVSSRRCGMITRREAERLVKSFLDEIRPPKLPETFAFELYHKCGWGCRGKFFPARYNSSRAKCIQCTFCSIFFSPNKFIFHCHRPEETGQTDAEYRHPDAANFNAWRRHLFLGDSDPSEDLNFAWEDVKAMFNGGNRKRVVKNSSARNVPSPNDAMSPGNDFDHADDSSDNCMPEAKLSRMSSSATMSDGKSYSLTAHDSFKSGNRLMPPDNTFNYQSTTGMRSTPQLKSGGQQNLWSAFQSNKSQMNRANVGMYKNASMNHSLSVSQHATLQNEIVSFDSARFKNSWPLFWARHLEMLQKSQATNSAANNGLVKPSAIPYNHTMMNNSFLAAHFLSQNFSAAAAAANCLTHPNPIDMNSGAVAAPLCGIPPPNPGSNLAAMQQFQTILHSGFSTIPSVNNFFRSSDQEHSTDQTAATSYLMDNNNKQLNDMKAHSIDSIIKNK